MRKLNTLSKILHINYTTKVEAKIKSNPRVFWKFVNSKKSYSDYPTDMFLGSVSSSNRLDICNLFASYFKSNHVIDSPSVNLNFLNGYPSPVTNLNLGFLNLNDDDVLTAITKLDNSKKIDSDGICPFLLKQCAVAVCGPLSILFNNSLNSGHFIEKWKLASITPIFKSGNKSDISNYRPISKLSTISKLFESIVSNKLYYLVKSIICPNQHGFIKRRSTVTNLALFTNFCHKSFSQKKHVHVIYTDFAKAFDRVSHSVLLNKLSILGIHSTFLKWISSYLSNRISFVSINENRSDSFIVSSGVPQGSILGPLLFTLFINDVPKCFMNSHCLLYADDLKLFRTVNNSYEAELLQSDLYRLSDWCKLNRLPLNVSKCFYMCYSRARNSFLFNYSINCIPLHKLDLITDLGVVFDSSLSFTSHFNHIITKAFSMIGFIKRHSSEFSDPYSLKCLYVSLVRSQIEYATIIWNPLYEIHIKRLERTQRVFTRFAIKTLHLDFKPSSDTRNLLIGLDSLETRRTFLSLMFIRDIVCGDIDCPELLSFIHFHVPARSVRHNKLFYYSNYTSNYALGEPVTRVLKLYNDLSCTCDIDFSLPKVIFKNNLINFLRSK